MPIKRGDFRLLSRFLDKELYQIDNQILFWGGDSITFLQVELHSRCDVYGGTYQQDEF